MILARRPLLSVLLAVLAVVGEAAAIEVDQTLTNQRFEWNAAYGSRSAGTYGQYPVALEAGRTYEILTSDASGGTTRDTYLYLLNASLTVVASDDDSNGNLQSKITYTPSASGTFYIRLRAYQKRKYGFCSLTVRAPPPPPPAGSMVIGPGDTLNDQYFAWESTYASRVSGTYASYTIDMTAETVYTFTTSNAHGGNTTDTYLYLLNSAQTVVASDDDSNGNLASRLVYRPSAAGPYTLKLRAYDRGAYGYATLAVVSEAQSPGNPQPPDLIVWAEYLSDASIEGSSQKLLRFSNAVPNIGVGPLELYGTVQPDGTTFAYQRVWNDNATFSDYHAGTFVFEGHESHNHWHFADFADYNLRSVTADGGVGALVATSQKVTFCLMDVIRYDPAAGPSTYRCDHQGIAVGWADVYDKALEGQWIDITSVPDGTYWLESVADPADRLRETNNTNNISRIRVQIDKTTNTVTILP
jgi:lysyl oxidase/pre-peptidase